MIDLSEKTDNRVIARLGLLATGAFLLMVALAQWEQAGDANHPYLVVLSFITYLAAFVLIVVAVSGYRLHFASKLILVAFIFALIIRFYLHVADRPIEYGTDSLAFTHYSAELFLEGKNPYAEDLSASYAEFRVSPLWRTPTLDGSYEVFLPYPSLHFLIFVPYVLMGLQDMRYVVLLFHILVMLAVFLAAPRALQPVVLIPFFIDPNIVNYTLGTVSDFIWVFFLLSAALMFPRHRAMSALFYGLSCSIKQQPWFLAPFLAVLLWQEARRRNASISGAASAILGYLNLAVAVFLVANLPFIIADPSKWLRGVLAPMVDPLIMYGQGFSTLTQTGLAALPKGFFLVAIVTVTVALMALYWKEYTKLKHTLWFYPAIILWFSYRSLQSYFIYLVPVMLVALFAFLKDRTYSELPAYADESKSNVRPNGPIRIRARTIALIVMSLLFIGGVGYSELNRRPEAIHVTRMFLRSEGSNALNGLLVQVTNPTDRLVQPRFWVKMTGQQMLGWDVISGPAVLSRGQTASYTLRESLPEHAIWVGGTATIIMMDTSTDNIVGYSPAFRVDPYNYSGLVNPDYRYWIGGPSSDSGYPLGWALTTEGQTTPQDASMRLSERAGLSCLALNLTRRAPSAQWGRIVLDQWADLPGSALDVLVYPDTLSSTQVPPTTAMGIEVLDGTHRIWYLFGGTQESYMKVGDTAYFYLPTQLSRWSTHTIDISRDLTELEWGIPPFMQIPGDSLNQLRRKLNFRFFVGTSDPFASTLGGCFGPIVNRLR